MKSVNILGLSIHVNSVETTLQDMKIYCSTKKTFMVGMKLSSVKNVMKYSQKNPAFKDTLMELFMKMGAVKMHAMFMMLTFVQKENC